MERWASVRHCFRHGRAKRAKAKPTSVLSSVRIPLHSIYRTQKFSLLRFQFFVWHSVPTSTTIRCFLFPLLCQECRQIKMRRKHAMPWAAVSVRYVPFIRARRHTNKISHRKLGERTKKWEDFATNNSNNDGHGSRACSIKVKIKHKTIITSRSFWGDDKDNN